MGGKGARGKISPKRGIKKSVKIECTRGMRKRWSTTTTRAVSITGCDLWTEVCNNAADHIP
jgi:hypothetical protein